MGFAVKFDVKKGLFIDEKTGQEINHEDLQEYLNTKGVRCTAGRGHVILVKLIYPERTLANLIKAELGIEEGQKDTLPHLGLDCLIKEKYLPPKRAELDYLLTICCSDDYAEKCRALIKYNRRDKGRI